MIKISNINGFVLENNKHKKEKDLKKGDKIVLREFKDKGRNKREVEEIVERKKKVSQHGQLFDADPEMLDRDCFVILKKKRYIEDVE